MYNFVFFSTPSDFYDIAYKDIKHLQNVRYIRNILEPKNVFLKFCFKFHFYFQYKKKIYNPLKSIWNKYLFNDDFNDGNPICFIFNERMLYLDNYCFVDYLKEAYPNAKFVCYLQDLINTINNVNIEVIVNKFDLSISYDKGDANKYGLFYYPTPYSFHQSKMSNDIKQSDVFFVGRAKNRLNEILAIYVKLKEKGLSCDFNIIGVEPKDQLYAGDIHYNTLMTYEENLQHVMKTKCLLEIMQQGASGYTFRTWEAIMYDKLLLTDNIYIEQAPFYQSQYIKIYNDSSDLDVSFISDFVKKIDYEYKDMLSPKFLLDYIETKI